MTAEMDLDRRLERWFADEAPAHAPDRVLTGAIEVVDRTPQRRGLTVRAGRQWAGMTRSRRVAFALVALLLAVVAAAAIGALVDRLAPGDHPASLVIVRSDDGTDQAQAVTVVERAADGTERTLAHYTADQLGGAVQLWLGSAVISNFDHLALPIGRADGTYGYAIADVRDPTAPIQQLDITGSYGAFGPDGDLGLSTPEGLAVHDPFSGTSSSTGLVPVDGNPPYPPTALDQFLSWAADGSGVLADEGMFLGQDDGTTKASAIGILHRDGEFIPGTVPLRYDGVRARRTDPTGVLLRCAGGYDSCYDAVEWSIYAVTNDEMHVVWDNPGTDRRISDFAWAADGGLWLLLETAAPGPRHVSLVRVAPDGVETIISEFDAPADDPDEGSYFQSSTFAAMAPDDSHLAVRISGDQGSPGATWLIDPATGERQEITGSIAGWRKPGGADRKRPDATMVTPTDPLIRDLWADAATSVRIGATSIALDAVGEAVPGTVARTSDDELTVDGDMPSLGCTAGTRGRYRWTIDGDRLTLLAIDEPCPERGALMGRTFDRSLSTSQDGPPHVTPGATYRAAAFGPSFVVTIPDAGGADDVVELWGHRPGMVGLTPSDPNATAASGVTILAPAKGANDVCEHFGEASPLAPGAAGILAYLEGHDLPLLDEVTTEVDGHAATTFRLEAPAGCSTDNHSGLTLFSGGDESPTSVGDGARLIVFELQDGTPIVIIDRADPADPEAVAWSRALIDSIRFDQP